ncbi:hypothetical protein [Thalassiella azotivora]
MTLEWAPATRYVLAPDQMWRAHGRSGIFHGQFVVGTTRPTAENSGVPGGTVLRTPAQIGLPVDAAGDVVITDAYHAANKTGDTLIVDAVDLPGFVKARTGLDVLFTRSRIRGSRRVEGTRENPSQRTALLDCNHQLVGSLGHANVRFEQCDLIPSPEYASEGIDGVVGHDYELYRCKIADVVDFFGWFNSYAPTAPLRILVEGCHASEMAYFSPCSYQPDLANDGSGLVVGRTHNDGSQGQGNHGVRYRGNTILANVSTRVGNGFPKPFPEYEYPYGVGDPPASNPYYPSVTGQALVITPNVSHVYDVMFEDGWWDYGAQIMTITDNNNPCTDVTITGNRFGQNMPALTRVETDGVGSIQRRRAILATPGAQINNFPTTTHTLDTVCGNVWDVDGPLGNAGDPIRIHRGTP